MESVPDGLNRDGYASSTSLLSNPPGRRWSIGKTVSKRGVGDVDPRHGSSPRVFLSVGDPWHPQMLHNVALSCRWTDVKCHGNPATRLSRLDLTQCPTSV